MHERTIGLTRAFAGRRVTLEVAEVELADGTRARREIVRVPPAVGVLAALPDGRLVLIRQFRAPIGQEMWEVVAGCLALSGSLFVLLAAVGAWRFPDVFMRMHAASKSTTLGLGLVIAGVVLAHPDAPTLIKCAVTVLFIFVTTPIAAHMLARAAYLHKTRMSGPDRHDELEGKYSRKDRTLARSERAGGG